MQTYQKRRHRKKSRFRTFWLVAQITILLAIVICLVVFGIVFLNVSKMLPDGSQIASYKPVGPTKIISCDGVVLAEISKENRVFVPINNIPKDLCNATIAIEDSRFYEHPGIDPIGIGRAIIEDIKTASLGQGGSTLTQQLVRNVYLSREKTFSRKLQEMALAIQLERHKTKDEILELYLNQVYYGSGTFGVQAAARTYFGKDVRDLSLAECALIAGLPQKPSIYSPYENLGLAIKRRNTVLKRMEQLGYISKDECNQAMVEEVKLVGLKPRGIAKYKAPWFVTYVIKELGDKYNDLIYAGGFKIYTTLNYEMQKAAEEALREGVKNAKRMGVGQGALVCIDPQNGYIKAMVGSANPDFVKDQYNRVTQAKRQPGSTFKAFVYTAAIDNGYSPYYRISNSKITYRGAGGKPWTPRNDNGRYGGTYTIKNAVAQSINVCAVRMADKIGIDEVIKYARLLGIKSKLDRTLPLALGASAVTPLEMCSAYGVFAANGMRAEPMSVVRITQENPDGTDDSVIEQIQPKVSQVLSTETAETMNEIFRAVVTSGTARRGVTGVRNAHGKTGTTSNDRNAWFIGYTPELVAAVWVGNDDNSPMRNAYGGNVCAPIWSKFMQKALVAYKQEKSKMDQQDKSDDNLIIGSDSTKRDSKRTERPALPERITVKICAESGMVASPKCPTTYEVSYDKGTEPKEICALDHVSHQHDVNIDSAGAGDSKSNERHYGGSRRQYDSTDDYVTVTICVDSGQIANEYCKETIVKKYRRDEAPTKVCRMHGVPEY